MAPTTNFNIHIAVINTLVSGMVREVTAIRRFELVGGLSVICDLFKLKDTPKEVKYVFRTSHEKNSKTNKIWID